MTEKKEKKWNTKSRVISARLHPSDIREKDALEIIDKLTEKGFSIRQIITDAILRSDGRNPEMYKRASDNLTKGYLESTLEDFAGYLLSKIGSGEVSVKSNDAKDSLPFDADEDEDVRVMNNLAAGFLARKNRGDK